MTERPPNPEHDDAGRGGALDAELYTSLRAIATAQMRREAGYHTLQPTAVVHEAFLRLGGPEDQRWNDREHFISTAVTTIRRVLVDHARARNAQKRGGVDERLRLTSWDCVDPAPSRAPDVLEVHEALTRLESIDPDCARVVELRYFGGLSIDETAASLEIGRNTVVRRWRAARAWLMRELAGDAEGAAGDDIA